ncbi:MAG: hypothetical protein ACXAD7_28065 [Candidatus Kariarchaeaceae archaeon]|jgi:hypothetical protein
MNFEEIIEERRKEFEAIIAQHEDGNWAVAYYFDGRMVDATNGLLGENARGIQAILQYNRYVETETVTGADYYIQDPRGIWVGMDIFGLFCFLLDNPQTAMGTMMPSTDEYNAIMNMLRGHKNGWLAREKRPDKS